MDFNVFCFFVVAIHFAIDTNIVSCHKETETDLARHLKKETEHHRKEQYRADLKAASNKLKSESKNLDQRVNSRSHTVDIKGDIDHPYAILTQLRLKSKPKVEMPTSRSESGNNDFRKFKWKKKVKKTKTKKHRTKNKFSGKPKKLQSTIHDQVQKLKTKHSKQKSKTHWANDQVLNNRNQQTRGTARLLEAKTELAKTKSLLRQTMTSNKLLKKQNRRLKQVWKAMEQMCNALHTEPEDEEQEHIEEQGEETEASYLDSFDMYPLEVTRTPYGETNTTWTVTYKAHIDSTEEWRTSDGDYQNTIYSVGTRRYDNNTGTFVTTHPTTSDGSLQEVVVRHNDTEMIVYLSCCSELDTAVVQTQTLSDPQISIEKLNGDIIARVNETFTSFFIVHGNTSGYQFQASAEFQTVHEADRNTPPAYVSVRSHTDHLNVSWTRVSDSLWNVSVQIDNMYSRFGGILSLTMFVRPLVYDLQRVLVYSTYYRKDYEILSNIGSKLVAVLPGRWVLRPLPNTTWLMLPNQALICLAMGNPRPDDVVLSKVTQQGYTDVKTQWYEFKNKYIVVKRYWLTADEPGIEGNYVCRVSNLGQSSSNLETKTKVKIYEDARIIEAYHTGDRASGAKVEKNNQVDVFCMASGRPRPTVQLTLDEHYGPDLMLTKHMKFRRFPNATTEYASVRVPAETVSVHCNALQFDRIRDTIKIQIENGGATGADGMPDISQLLMQLQNPEIISALSADPELLSAFSDPEVGAALQDISTNPDKISTYQNNEKLKKVIDKLTSMSTGGG